MPWMEETHSAPRKVNGRGQRTVCCTNHRIGRKIVGIANKQHAVIKLENLSASAVHRIQDKAAGSQNLGLQGAVRSFRAPHADTPAQRRLQHRVGTVRESISHRKGYGRGGCRS